MYWKCPTSWKESTIHSELSLMFKLFLLLHLFTHLSMLFLSLHSFFPPPLHFLFLVLKLFWLKSNKFHHVCAKWWKSGSGWGLCPLPPASCLPRYQAQHIFILSSVPQNTLVAFLLLGWMGMSENEPSLECALWHQAGSWTHSRALQMGSSRTMK